MRYFDPDRPKLPWRVWLWLLAIGAIVALVIAAIIVLVIVGLWLAFYIAIAAVMLLAAAAIWRKVANWWNKDR